MCCCNNCFNTNYMCSSSSLTDPVGSFYYPCDGMKRLIYFSSTARPTMTLNITNTGSCTLTVELSQVNAGTITPKIYTVDAGKSLVIKETNITNVYITGTSTPTPCYPNNCNCCWHYNQCNCCCHNYCSCYSGASGNYSIAN